MSTMRIGGLMSGMDTQAIVDRLLENEARRVTKVQEQKVKLEDNVAIWSGVSAEMTTLTDALYRLRTLTTWSSMTAESSDATALSAAATSSAQSAAYDIGISQLARAQSVASDSASELELTGIEDKLVDKIDPLEAGQTFEIEGQTITLATSDSLLTLAGKINSAAEEMDDDVRVQATIIDHRLVITRMNTGAAEMAVTDTDGVLANLGVLEEVEGEWEWKHQLREGLNAEFTVNGADVVRASNTNLTDVINGVTLNLQDTTVFDLTLTIGRDTESIKTAINDFIAAYNTVAATIEEHTAVDMTDPKKPVAGPLQGDSLAQNILRNMRRLATQSQAVLTEENAAYSYAGNEGVADSLQALGIWTSGQNNRLSITDETRLDYMLENHYDEVEQIFRGAAPEGGGANVGGVARNFHAYSENVSSPLTGEIAQRVNAIQERIGNTDTTLDRLYRHIDNYEKRLWDQFGAMESAIAKMQQELSWLTGQLGGMSQ
jgi:flagellar hook-associated protein 2